MNVNGFNDFVMQKYCFCKQIEIKNNATQERIAEILNKAVAFLIFNKLRQNVTVPK